MRRLYLQIYVAIVGILVVFAVLAGIAWHRGGLGPQDETLGGAASLVAERLPPAGGPADRQRALRELAARLRLDLTLWSPDGQALAAVGPGLPFPGRRAQSGWMPARGGPVGVLRLPDGRWLVGRADRHRTIHAGLVLILAALALAVAVGAYPVAPRLTRRPERL